MLRYLIFLGTSKDFVLRYVFTCNNGSRAAAALRAADAAATILEDDVEGSKPKLPMFVLLKELLTKLPDGGLELSPF